jgi:hypothetical protein
MDCNSQIYGPLIVLSPLAAGRWPLAAGRWPLAAGRRPLAPHRYVTLHHITYCYDTLWYITLGYVTLFYVILRYVTLLGLLYHEWGIDYSKKGLR